MKRILGVIISMVLMVVIAIKIGRASYAEEESLTLSDSLTPPQEESRAFMLNHEKKEKPSPSLHKTENKVKTHEVSLLSEDSLVYIYDKDKSPGILLKVQSALGADIKPSRSGRTGKEIHFPAGTLRKEAEAKLSEMGIPVHGELVSFSFQSAHQHSSCATCLVPNYQALRALPGVLQVPSFLGDKESSLISVVIDKEKVSTDSIITTLKTDHNSEF